MGSKDVICQTVPATLLLIGPEESVEPGEHLFNLDSRFEEVGGNSNFHFRSLSVFRLAEIESEKVLRADHSSFEMLQIRLPISHPPPRAPSTLPFSSASHVVTAFVLTGPNELRKFQLSDFSDEFGFEFSEWNCRTCS